jgi:hypothetical protein
VFGWERQKRAKALTNEAHEVWDVAVSSIGEFGNETVASLDELIITRLGRLPVVLAEPPSVEGL